MGFFSSKCGNSQESSRKQPQLSIKNTNPMLNTKTNEMRRVFDKFDSNKDGKISKEEYKFATKALGMIGNVEKEFQIMDKDRDGFIDFNEFMEVQKVGGEKRDHIEDAFRAYDLDGNGKISAEELLAVMKKLGERCSLKSCRKMVKAVDLDGDGLIDINEFTRMMTNTKAY